MIDGDFAAAFTGGLLAVANPCGFAMLPAYLSFFLGLEGAEGPDARASLSRALAVGLCVSAGFAATFAVAGLAIKHLTDRIYEWGPWVSVVIGFALAALGVLFLVGREPKLALPRLDRGGQSAGVRSMALYGVSYAVVSLGCTMPTFLAVVGLAMTRRSLLAGVTTFLAYAAGFAVLLTALTVTLALARRSLIRAVRRALPHVQRASGALLLLAGLYVAWYGWYEIRRTTDSDPIVRRVTGWSDDVRVWVANTGPTRIGLVLALVLAGAAVFVASARSRARAR